MALLPLLVSVTGMLPAAIREAVLPGSWCSRHWAEPPVMCRAMSSISTSKFVLRGKERVPSSAKDAKHEAQKQRPHLFTSVNSGAGRADDSVSVLGIPSSWGLSDWPSHLKEQ